VLYAGVMILSSGTTLTRRPHISGFTSKTLAGEVAGTGNAGDPGEYLVCRCQCS
jgi:hypothetical protein